MDILFNLVFYILYAGLFSILPVLAYRHKRLNICASLAVAAGVGWIASFLDPVYPMIGMNGLGFLTVMVLFTLPLTLITLLIWVVSKWKNRKKPIL